MVESKTRPVNAEQGAATLIGLRIVEHRKAAAIAMARRKELLDQVAALERQLPKIQGALQELKLLRKMLAGEEDPAQAPPPE